MINKTFKSIIILMQYKVFFNMFNIVIDTETLKKQTLSCKIIRKYHLLKLYKLHDTTSLRSYRQIHLEFFIQ